MVLVCYEDIQLKDISSQILQLKSVMANIIAFSITTDVGSRIPHFGDLCLFFHVVTMEM